MVVMDDGGSKNSDSKDGKGRARASFREEETVLLGRSKRRKTAQTDADLPPQEGAPGPTEHLSSSENGRKRAVDAGPDTEVDAAPARKVASGRWVVDVGTGSDNTTTRPWPGGSAAPAGLGAADSIRFRDLDAFLDEIRKPTSKRLRADGVIAKGGMGTVELAVDTALRRRVARKVMHPELEEKARFVWLFLREARIMGQLDHPNIVPVHELGVDGGGRLFFTMKRVVGRPLSHIYREWVGRPCPGSWSELCSRPWPWIRTIDTPTWAP
jgi:hypothetical protein